MRLILMVFCFIPFFIKGQQFELKVTGGYGGGFYRAGDTVHIWAREEKLTETFRTWTGDTTYLGDPGEWHTRLLMPAKNISVAANFINLPAGAKLTFEKMKGRDTIKPVQYYFPAKDNKMKALVWIFHGSGGSVNEFTGQVEGVSIIKTLIANDYAVAISECDESTFHKDFNNDGNTRWEYPIVNNMNRDMQNHAQFRDTFIARGYMDAKLPQMGLGFSAGGSFAISNGFLMKFVKGITFCAPGLNFIGDQSTMPTQWFMSLLDNHPDVGKEGNDTAIIHFNKLRSRGVCAGYNMLLPSPCYPEYFRRILSVDSIKSSILFNELKSMTALNAQNFFRLNPDLIKLVVIANPVKYPTLISLTPDQEKEMDFLILVLNAGHHQHSHFNAKLIRFLDSDCTPVSTPYINAPIYPPFKLYPNPARDRIKITMPILPDQNFQAKVYDISGRCVQVAFITSHRNDNLQLNLSSLNPGVYSITLYGDRGYFHVSKLNLLY